MSNFSQNFEPFTNGEHLQNTEDRLIHELIREISNNITVINQTIVSLDVQAKYNNEKLFKLETIVSGLQNKSISYESVIDRLQEVVLEGRTGQTSQIVTIDRLLRDIELLNNRINKIEKALEQKEADKKSTKDSVWAWAAAIIGSLITALLSYLAQYVKFTPPTQ